MMCKDLTDIIIPRGDLEDLSDLVPDLYFVVDLGPEMGSRRPRSCLKRLLVAVGFTLTDYGPVGSHGDPIRGRKYGFGTAGMCCVETADMCCVAFADMCCVEIADMCSAETAEMSCVAPHPGQTHARYRDRTSCRGHL